MPEPSESEDVVMEATPYGMAGVLPGIDEEIARLLAVDACTDEAA